MLAARYAALFPKSERSPDVASIAQKGGKSPLTPEVMAEALAQRPIVLIGDVGVGKTSFFKQLRYITAKTELQNAIYIHLDLGSRGALNTELNEFILTIEEQLLKRYEIDVFDNNFIRAAYHVEIGRFQKGLFGSLQQTDPAGYEQRLLDFLNEKASRRDRHLRESIAHISKSQRKQIVIILDNADQRSDAIQQDAFIVAQNFAQEWKANVFIAIQPRTFYQSKQSGALRSYANRVFTIAPPRIELVIERRLTFALNMAEGRIPVELFSNIGLKLNTIAIFIRALLYSLEHNNDILEFLSNFTGGNIRFAVDFITKFIGSANIDSAKIIDIMSNSGRYIVPVHEFWKAALLGEYSYYDPVSSIAINMFDIASPNPNEHFLLPLLLGYLDLNGSHKSKEGFVPTAKLLEEAQNFGFALPSVELALRRANNKNLIETAERITFAEGKSGLFGQMPENFRLSTVGAYHLKRWIGQFAYLDAMSYDTPILEPSSRDEIASHLGSFAIEHRLSRALSFRSYLSGIWAKFHAPTYL